jgi:hypothetical protein
MAPHMDWVAVASTRAAVVISAKLVATVSNGATHTQKSSDLDGVHLSLFDGGLPLCKTVRRLWA